MFKYCLAKPNPVVYHLATKIVTSDSKVKHVKKNTLDTLMFRVYLFCKVGGKKYHLSLHSNKRSAEILKL